MNSVAIPEKNHKPLPWIQRVRRAWIDNLSVSELRELLREAPRERRKRLARHEEECLRAKYG